MIKQKKQDKKIDIAETILENPDTFKLIDKILTNSKVQSIIDRLFFRKTLKYGLVMACLLTGMFSVVNGLIIGLNLGWAGWVTSGTVLSLIGGFYTLRQLKKDGEKPCEGLGESPKPD
jgi:hypothetical protein